MWLPKLHVESPASSRMVLARLLLKIGTYGFTRLLSNYG
jgi:NADH:ubiquinone oxidoreductase subunit 4 (subunit M)